MVIDMNETRLRTIEQIENFLKGKASIEFSAAGDDAERYAHISRVLERRLAPLDRTLRREIYAGHISSACPLLKPTGFANRAFSFRMEPRAIRVV